MKFNWKVGGEAGFGIMTTGLALSKIAARSGYHIYDYSEYPSLIRGGHNTYEVVISDEEVHSLKWEIDMLVCLNKATYDLDKHRLTKNTMVIYDPDEFEPDGECVKVPVTFKKYKEQFVIQQIMVNTIALGATLALLQADLEILHDLIKAEFARKGEQIVEFNLKLAKTGYDHVINNHKQFIKPLMAKKTGTEKMVMGGNDAFAFASVAADCRYYAAYPMTPSSSVLMTLAEWQNKTGMVVRHSEDEIAVINSALGASFSGVRASVGTSGGGFALMVEALSYAGVAEIPVVVYLGQRPGPATGMPTWTEQGDLLFAAHAGHGEFPKIVLAPGDIKEMIELSLKAYDLADVYQTPVIVISDKVLGESHKSDEKEYIMNVINKYHPNRGKTVLQTTQEKYLRYKLSDDGISERLIPGQKGQYYQANSYEHVEDSHTTEDSLPRIQQVNKRQVKWDVYMKKQHAAFDGNLFFEPPAYYGDEKAEIVFVSWGGMKGTVLEAQRLLNIFGKRTGFIHFTHVYPIHEEMVKPLFSKNKRYILVENNSHAQFGQLLRMQTGIEITEKLLKYDGRPFWPEEISEYIVPKKTIQEQNPGEKAVIDKLQNLM